MLNINFVPDEYNRNNDFHRTNLIYIALFVVVMAGLIGCFTTIKISQKACLEREKLVDTEMEKKRNQLKQVEELQDKSSIMWKTALTTAELLEPVSRSVLLASLTNNLPSGVSLLNLSLTQKEPRITNQVVPLTNKYQQLQNSNDALNQPKLSPEQLLETNIDIEGIAPSDIQVAAYIKKLSNSALFESIALVESKEYKIEGEVFRRFTLKTALKKNVHMTKDNIEEIKVKS